MNHLRLVYSAPVPQAQVFHARDLIALSGWIARPEQHGYSRVQVEGDGAAGPENAAYVLVYEHGRDWASWGLARAGDRIDIWHCGTGADMCSFPEMSQALESLPRVGFSLPTGLRPQPSPGTRSNTRASTREIVAAAPPRPRLTLVHQS